MNRYQTLCTALLLGALLCSMSGCQSGKNNNGVDADKLPEPRYKTDTVIIVTSGDYRYLARVTNDTPSEAEQVQVHVFNESIREKIGDTVPLTSILELRGEPPGGWGTQPIALEYFNGETWEFQLDVLAIEGAYLLPERVEGKRRIEFANVRFPINVPKPGRAVSF